VHIAYGSDTGLIPPTGQEFVPVFSQGADGLLDTAEQNDDFGFELVAGNFGAGAASDPAIGAPGEDNSRGVVHVLFGLGLPIVSAVVGGGLLQLDCLGIRRELRGLTGCGVATPCRPAGHGRPRVPTMS
jgi:hypothetical protein